MIARRTTKAVDFALATFQMSGSAGARNQANKTLILVAKLELLNQLLPDCRENWTLESSDPRAVLRNQREAEITTP
jgi:hypothetical protein